MKKVMILAAALSCISAQSFAQDAKRAIGALSSGNGRYVFGQISDFRKDQYMLDTQTGRLWQIVLNKPKNPDGTEGAEFISLDWVPYTQVDSKLATPPVLK